MYVCMFVGIKDDDGVCMFVFDVSDVPMMSMVLVCVRLCQLRGGI